MNDVELTIIIILHNRHKNVDRLYEYYNNSKFHFILADSSKEKHVFENSQHNWKHIYVPGYTFTQKIEYVLNKVKTPYVAMCADDDFILTEALNNCITFLNENPSYSITQGLSIRYIKETILSGEINFSLLYRSSKSIESQMPLLRLQEMFNSYRSVLYAVFRTDALQYAFTGAGEAIKNLFLNEYITAFIPIIKGKYKELPVLYQIREYALDSDDKTATNLDTLAINANAAEQIEYVSFKNFITGKIQNLTTINKQEIEQIIQKFSLQLSKDRKQKISFKKKIGLFINKVPLLGKWMINKNRYLETKNDLKTVIQTEADKQNMDTVKDLILRYK